MASLLRRLIFVFTVFYIDNSSFQVLIITYVNLMVLLYIIKVKPLHGYKNNLIEIINESLIFIICFHTQLFAGHILDIVVKDLDIGH